MSTTVEYVVITYDQLIITDSILDHNKPDILKWDKEMRKLLIVDVEMPMERNVVLKIAEKYPTIVI